MAAVKGTRPSKEVPMAKHTDECLKRLSIISAAIVEYEETYPHYCRACGGGGEDHWTENGAPHGAGFWPMPMSDYCEKCMGIGVCPRCGGETIHEDWDDKDACSHCGWTIGEAAVPELPEKCDCYIEASNVRRSKFLFDSLTDDAWRGYGKN